MAISCKGQGTGRCRRPDCSRIRRDKRLGLYKIFVCLFREGALINTILGIQHLLHCTRPRCMLQSILSSTWFPPAPPASPFNIQYWQSQSCVKAAAQAASALAAAQVSLYKIFILFEVFVHESITPFYCPPPALPTLLLYYYTTFAQYTTLPRPDPPVVFNTPYNVGNGNIV